MKKRFGHFLMFVVTLLFFQQEMQGQPLLSTRKEVAGIEVFRDIEKSRLWYFAPGKLKLATEKDGKPRFQLVQMRYTGTGASGNQGEKRYLNLAQLTVWMEQISSEKLEEVREALGGSRRRIKLEPMPMKSIDAFLVVPSAEGGGRYKKAGSSSSLGSGLDDGSGYWSERTFTIRLDNSAAELFWGQIEKGELVMSVGYGYYANVVTLDTIEYKVRGDRESKEELEAMLDEWVERDSTPEAQLINAGAFPVMVDVKTWPDLIKKIDLNEGLPPAWAVLELRCYDFANDLRPELAMKTVEVEASGIKGDPVLVKGLRFMSSKPGKSSLQVHFPYAVDLSKPYRFRVTEFTEEGERKALPWEYRENWADLLDVTTPEDQIRNERHELEIELDLESLENSGLEKYEAVFLYENLGEKHKLTLSWEYGDSDPVKTLRFYADKNSEIRYFTQWRDDEGWGRSYSRKVGTDDYVYLEVKEE